MALSEGSLLLHTGRPNKNASKSLIAAEYSGVKVDVVPNFQMGVSNKTPEFLKLNPMGKVPVLETPEGVICESNAIARYVLRLKSNSLLGTSLIDQAHVDQWVDFATTEIDANLAKWTYPRFGYGVYSAEVEEHAISQLKRALAALNTYLASQTYMVGHSVTLADIVLVCNLSFGYVTVLTEEFTADYPHIDRYFWTVVRHPQFKKHLGDVVRGQIPVPPPPSRTSAAADKSPQVGKEKSSKQHVEPSKPKEEEPKPKELPDMEEEEAAPKPKEKNPLDLLPPSTMVLDEWKRLYSNTKSNFHDIAIKGFWEMYDPEGYSLWFCDYKYNDENAVPFVTMNKVSGFLQRMDFIRKYAFGKLCILGEAAPFKIKGVWLFRGPEIPRQVKDECYDVELYDWSKVDVADEAQIAKVNAYFEEPDVIEGEKLLEAKCFK